MIIINEEHITEIGIDWDKTIAIIEDSVKCLRDNDFAQPVKPYLRYRNRNNRVIAMPAFVGGEINMAGIKWIASFPENIKKGLPRAHSVIILNNADTGEPIGIINTVLLSIIRTASVSGLVIKYFDKVRDLHKVIIGITGFGPIGQYHLKMCLALFGDRIDKILLYDIRQINESIILENEKVELVNSWENAYINSDIFITCTVSDVPYIDKQPKSGSLHLNVSLRDYKTEVFKWFKGAIIVDDWEEACRENTDVELMHLEKGLQKEDTASIIDIIQDDLLKKYSIETPIMFNPMGMAVFDIAIGNFYYQIEASKIQV